MQKARAWGFRYLKLDFLYAGALPGVRHKNLPREQAYRDALQVMREAMGDDAYFLACGAPIIPSLGLCDALRIGPDVAAKWESRRDAMLLHNPAIPGTRNAIRTTMNRLWLMPAIQLDPDVAYFSPLGCDLTPEQRELLQGLALICGFKATSDLPGWLTERESEQLREFLLASPKVVQTGPRSFRIDKRELDFASAMELTDAPTGWTAVESALFGWIANQAWALQIDGQFAKWAARRRARANSKVS